MGLFGWRRKKKVAAVAGAPQQRRDRRVRSWSCLIKLININLVAIALSACFPDWKRSLDFSYHCIFENDLLNRRS
jgi:hypothetical protein